MTQTFGTNSNNDLYIGSDGNLVLLSGIEAVVAACKTACLAQLGECVLQQGIGLPNFQSIWVGTPDFALWQTYLQNTLLNVDGVIQVNSIKITVQKNTLNFVANIESIFGTAQVTG